MANTRSSLGPVLLGPVLLGLLLQGCLGAEEDDSSGFMTGEACSAGEETSGQRVCSGASVLVCRSPEAGGGPVWATEADCSVAGQQCVAGQCKTPAAQPGPAGCPDFSGTWTFVEHCEPDSVGDPYVVTQSGCEFTVADPWNGWSGTVAASGAVTSSGPTPDGTVQCAGTYFAGADEVEATCQPDDCRVKLAR